MVTSNKLIVRHDVDLMISERLSKRFYELALALRREGFHPIVRIPDPELDKVLNNAGLSQEPVRTDQGGNWEWGLFPGVRNDKLRNLLGVNLDLGFAPESFETIPGHWNWVQNGDHDRLVQKVRNYSECKEHLFDHPKQSKMGLLVPSLEEQLQFLRLLLKRRSSKKVASAIAQLEDADYQRRVSSPLNILPRNPPRL
jgi:hypothetical protein